MSPHRGYESFIPMPVVHQCDPPYDFNRFTINSQPEPGAGSIWRCKCGARWQVQEFPGVLNAYSKLWIRL